MNLKITGNKTWYLIYITIVTKKDNKGYKIVPNI